MSLPTPLHPSLGKFTLFLFLLTILQLSFSSLASGQQPSVQPATGSPATANPCGVVGFQLYNLPADATLSKIVWFGNGNEVGTTYNVTDIQQFTVTANDGNWTYDIYAVVYYNGTSTQTAIYKQPIASIGLNPITQSIPANLGCTSPITFSTSFESGLGLYVPQVPSDVTSYTWSFPSSSWTITSSSMGSANENPTVTVTPDASSAGNVMVTTTLNCGYTFTSPVLAITRPTEPPTFGAGPGLICNNSTNTFTINPPCGATSYTWTISGNTQATFANGTQSLTTTATSAAISAGLVGTSGFSLSVQSVYPNGETSNATTESISTGSLLPSSISPASGGSVAPNSTVSFLAVGADSWSVGNGTILTGQGTDGITVKVANAPNSQLGVVATGTDACGVRSVVADYTISSSGGGTGCIICTTINPTADSTALSDSTFTMPSPVTSSLLYPNPSTNSFQVIIPQTDFTKTYVIIYDLNGHMVRAIIPNGQTTLVDASHWAKGTYIVSIFDGKKLTTQKLVKL